MNHPLPHWIERLLGIQTGPGEGAGWSVEHTWGWPPVVTLLFVLAAAAFVVLNYLRENPETARWFRMILAANRLALIGIVMFMLAQFVLLLYLTGLPRLAVVVDDSLSMTTADPLGEDAARRISARLKRAGLEEPTRFNQARALLCERDGALVRRLREEHELRLYYTTGPEQAEGRDVDAIVRQLRSREARGDSTRLGAALRAVFDDLRGMPPSAVILLTDGVNTAGPSLDDAANMAARKGVPLFTVGLGDERPVRDLKLTDLVVDDVVFVNDVVHFEFRIGGTGFAGQEANVVLRRLGDAAELARMTVKLPEAGESEVLRIPYRPTEEGEFRFVVEVEPMPGELQTDNNRRERLVRVRKEKIRVLLAYAYPSYEFRYLRNMLKRESTIQLDTVLQEADLGYAEQDATALRSFPVRREEVFRYDVIILGDLNPGLLSTDMLQNIAAFVDQPGKGGALVCIGGPRYMPIAFRGTPLDDLLPVRASAVRVPAPEAALASPVRIVPTELGLANPGMQLGDTLAQTREIWEQLPSVYWILDAPQCKPGARVLATRGDATGPDGQPLPAIVMHYVGAGKVLFHATDETWRWRYRVGDAFFARYWVQTIRYLCRSMLSDAGGGAELVADRREYQQGEPVTLRVRFDDPRRAPAADDGVTVVVEQQGRQTHRLELRRSAAGQGIFQGTLANPGIGDHHAWMAVPVLEGKAPSADFHVAAPPGEFEHIEMDAVALRRAAEQTGGRFYTWDNADRLLHDLPRGRPVPVESLPSSPLWNRWPVLLLFLALLVNEWVLRKWGAMV